MQEIQHTTLMFVAKNLNNYGTYVHILSVVVFFSGNSNCRKKKKSLDFLRKRKIH